MKTSSIASMVLLLAVGCAKRTPGARPHDMSEQAHVEAAEEHKETAEATASQHDPAAVAEVQCGPPSEAHTKSQPCWSRVANPTEAYLREAEEHRKMAADHRAASEALRQAEETACAGLAPDARDTSPFEYREDIGAVEPIVEQVHQGKVTSEVTMGAVVTFRAVPGLTAEWLQRVVDCHLARNAALGHEVPEMPDCPLVPRGATAQVSSTGTGFAVTIRGDSPESGQAILQRADHLEPAPAL